MDTAAPQWPVQGIGVVNKSSVEKKARPGKEQAALNCPRCASANTKFCYYNNYSLSQPRYFCKACRRYWTEGGCLRNVPVGGGSRKNRRPSSASAAAAAPSPIPSPNYKSSGGQDLNLAYNIGMSEYIALPFDAQNPNFQNHTPPPPLPVMEFFKPASVYGGGFSGEGYYGNLQGANDGGGNNNSSSRNVCVFPFGEMKQADQQTEQASHGFWNGMLAGGSTW